METDEKIILPRDQHGISHNYIQWWITAVPEMIDYYLSRSEVVLKQETGARCHFSFVTDSNEFDVIV